MNAMPRIVLTAALLAALGYTAGCDTRDSVTRTGTHEGYVVNVVEGPTKRMVVTDTVKNDYIVALETNGDNCFDALETSHAQWNEGLDAIANFDSIDAIYQDILYAAQYPQMKELWEPAFLIKPDTLIPFGHGMYGLTDLNHDGTMDVIQYLGSTPGHFGLILNEQVFGDSRINYQLKPDTAMSRYTKALLDPSIREHSFQGSPPLSEWYIAQ